VPESKEEWIQKVKKQLNEYQIGDFDLDQVFDPLLNACAKVAKNFSEFKQCVNEGLATLKSILSKTK